MKNSLIILVLFFTSCGLNNVTPINKSQWEEFFPERWGYGKIWSEAYTNLNIYYPAMKVDYYAYTNFVNALKELRKIKLREIAGDGKVTVYRFHSDNSTKEWEEIYSYPCQGTFTNEVNFSHFANRPNASRTDRNRELAAFLANISHEVGEGVGTNAYGLFYREELFFERSPDWGIPQHYYQDTNFTWFPPSPTPMYYPEGSQKAGEERFPVTSYHGRGPIQLSWNFNYGAFSAAVFGDKNILLKDPDKILESGKLGLMAAIWFWMMPQAPKPSIHDIMYPKTFTPTHIDKWGFGHSIVLINGFHESNAAYEGTEVKDQTVTRRINFYKRFAKSLGVPIGVEGEQLDTINFTPYGF